MGGKSSSTYLRDTFLNIFIKENDWLKLHKYFNFYSLSNNEIIPLKDYKLIYILEGEITIYYIDINSEKQPTNSNILKIITPNNLTILYDSEEIDFFSSNRKYKMILKTTSNTKNGTKFIGISHAKLLALLNQPNFQDLRSFFQRRPSELIQLEPFFRGLNPDQIAMVESCLRIVPVVENTTLIERGKRKKLEKGGEMCILLHGQCVTRSCLGTKLQPSLYSLHQLTAHEKKVAENTSKQHNTDRKSGVRLPWPQRGDSPVILPSHLNRSDKLIPLGSAIGGELCIRDDIEALQSVLVASPSIIGLISQQDLFHIDAICPTTIDKLNSNLAYLFLESITQTVPLLWNISPENLYKISKNVEILSVESETIIIDHHSHQKKKTSSSDKFYMIIKGEVEILYNQSSLESPSIIASPRILPPTYQPLLRDGDYFGELSLVLSQPITETVTATTSSILITMKKDVFIRYLNSPIGREMLSEMSIRLQGKDVPLIHMMRHSSGYQVFFQFLQSELSTESALFWKHVDKLEDLCSLWLCSTEYKMNRTNPHSTNAQAIQQLLHIPGTEEDILSPHEQTLSENNNSIENIDSETNRKKIDPNMSSSRIKIAYSASSFSVASDASITTFTNTVTQKYQKNIVTNLSTVLSLCEEIIKLYLTGMSQYEVNLPVTMLRQVKQEWSEFELLLKKSLEDEKNGTAIPLTEYHKLLHRGNKLFSRPKHEVFMLLKDDNYARFNKTKEFEDYIHKMRPYM